MQGATIHINIPKDENDQYPTEGIKISNVRISHKGWENIKQIKVYFLKIYIY